MTAAYDPNGGWLPLVVGYGIIVALGVALRLFPNAWWVAELRRSYRVQASGPLGRFAARDHFRSALVGVLLAVLLMALAFAVMTYGFRFTDSSTQGMLSQFYGFTMVLLSGVAFLAGLQSGVRGVQWRRRERREERFVAEHALLLARFEEIVARYDPVGVAAEGDPGEFAFQARRLLLAMPTCRSFDDAHRAVYARFLAWFRGAAGPPHPYAPMAQELWSTWQAGAAGANQRLL